MIGRGRGCDVTMPGEAMDFSPTRRGKHKKKKMIRDFTTIYVFVTMDYPNDY